MWPLPKIGFDYFHALYILPNKGVCPFLLVIAGGLYPVVELVPFQQNPFSAALPVVKGIPVGVDDDYALRPIPRHSYDVAEGLWPFGGIAGEGAAQYHRKIRVYVVLQFFYADCGMKTRYRLRHPYIDPLGKVVMVFWVKPLPFEERPQVVFRLFVFSMWEHIAEYINGLPLHYS